MYQVIFLDDSSQNLKPAREMGMTTILVKNPITALKDLQKVTGIDVSFIQLEWFLPSLWICAFRAVTSDRQTEAVWPSEIVVIIVVYSHDNYPKYLQRRNFFNNLHCLATAKALGSCRYSWICRCFPLFCICPLVAHLLKVCWY